MSKLRKYWVVRDEDGSCVTSEFIIGDRVWIDGEGAILGLVVAICIYEQYIQYQVAWWHAGDHKSDWFLDNRLTRDKK
jgi:hypothetical protein